MPPSIEILQRQHHHHHHQPHHPQHHQPQHHHHQQQLGAAGAAHAAASSRTPISRTTSIDSQLSNQFDQEVIGIQKILRDIGQHHLPSDEAERAANILFVQLSQEDNKLSQNGRAFFKSILVEDGALDDLLMTLRYKHCNPSFFRRICSCLTYFVRGSLTRSAKLIQLGGIRAIIDLMQRFPTNQTLLWYCFDLIGILVSANSSRTTYLDDDQTICYHQRILETTVDELVVAMMKLRILSSKLYKKAYPVLCNALSKTERLRDQISNYIAKKSHVMLHTRHTTPEMAQAAMQKNMQALLVCHDMLDNLVVGDSGNGNNACNATTCSNSTATTESSRSSFRFEI